MLNSLNSLIVIFTVIGTGYFLTKRGILSEETNKIFSTLVVNLGLPAMMVVSLGERFTKSELMRSGWWLLISFASVFLSYLGGKLLKKYSKTDSGIFLPIVSFSNTIFIGLPVNIALFGEEAIPYIFLYYLANTTFFWTLGVSLLKGGSGSLNVGTALKKLFNPPFMGFLVGIILIFTGIEIYSPFKTAFKYMGSITTPLSLLFIGTVLANQNLSGFKLGKGEFMMIIGKFFMVPAITFILLYIAGRFIEIPTLLKHVYIIQSSMPAMTNVAIVSRYYNRNYTEASLMVGVTTLLCIVTIPLYSFIITFIN